MAALTEESLNKLTKTNLVTLVTKLDKKKKTTSKKYDDGVMSAYCDVIVIFLIYGQIGAIRKLDSGCTVCKTYIFINSNLLSYKN